MKWLFKKKYKRQHNIKWNKNASDKYSLTVKETWQKNSLYPF